ncbi:MAG: cobalamin biosynthesis protein CobD [Deltaproteobacteria bacterium]|nr:MAG: cobalamin biosynthesis protein CobD [Deltaproteobacteria bacterium]
MRPEYQITAAVALDLVMGDPHWLPHPVKFIGRLGAWLERRVRSSMENEIAAGTVVGLLTISLVLCAAAFLIWVCGFLDPIIGDLASIAIIYFSIAIKDLAKHSKAVYDVLHQGDLELARSKTAMMVGRRTSELGEDELIRAAVESVAENTVDGIVAPLFYTMVFGPLGAIGYRAINTLDSMFGYKDSHYMKFGRFSARLDDLANFLPARIGALMVVPAAIIQGYRWKRAWKTLWRDRARHDSPNAGWPEAAFAGALGIRLGGRNVYGDNVITKPYLGDMLEDLKTEHIVKANKLMICTSLLFLATGVVLRITFTAAC